MMNELGSTELQPETSPPVSAVPASVPSAAPALTREALSSAVQSASTTMEHLLGEAVQTLMVTRQRVKEAAALTGLREAEADETRLSIAPALAERLAVLEAMRSDYERLSVFTERALATLREHSEALHTFGHLLYSIGMRESLPSLGRALRDLGEAHKSLAKESVTWAEALSKLGDLVKTFRSAAIEDALLSVHKFHEARLDYLGARDSAALLARGGASEAETRLSEKQRVFERLGDDVAAKIDLLAEKRAQDLALHLRAYLRALQSYAVKSSDVLARLVFTPDPSQGHHSAEAVVGIVTAEQRAHSRRGSTSAPSALEPLNPAPSGLAAFLGSVTQTLMVTKKRLQEALEGSDSRDAPPPEIQARLDALAQLTREADELAAALTALLASAKTLLYVERDFGEQLYSMGLREMLPALAHILRELGDAHRTLEKEGAPWIEALSKLNDLVKTFKGAAIEDARLSVHKFHEARLDFVAAQASLQLLTQAHDQLAQANPASPALVPEDAARKIEEKRALYERLGTDVDTKIQLLSEHRVIELSQSLSQYVVALRAHYARNLELIYALDMDADKDAPRVTTALTSSRR